MDTILFSTLLSSEFLQQKATNLIYYALKHVIKLRLQQTNESANDFDVQLINYLVCKT